MKLFNGLNISASALTANRLRMDVVSSNIANANTTRGKFVDGQWQPYQRKVVQMKEMPMTPFQEKLQSALGNKSTYAGVEVSKIKNDESPFKIVFDPSHPDADEKGYVKMPNVDIAKEMVDLMTVSRSYEANITTLNASKNMYMKALEIGK
jgi:flagellar basal-body rod protein FlgC